MRIITFIVLFAALASTAFGQTTPDGSPSGAGNSGGIAGSTCGLSCGDRVIVINSANVDNDRVRVRDDYDLSANTCGLVWNGATGRIYGSPPDNDGYTWWLIQWDAGWATGCSNLGLARIGYSAEGDGSECWLQGTSQGCCLASDCNDGIACTNDTCPNNTCQYTTISGCCLNDSGCSSCQRCFGNQCQTRCGNGTCEPNCGENTSSCSPDCQAVCGNGTCEAGETPSNCCQDCECPSCQRCLGGACQSNCGNGSCEPSCGETCSTCLDCTCQSGQQCQSGSCVTPPGACCVNENTCNTGVTQANCGGVWQGAGSTICQNCSPTGACCVNGNTCNTGVTQGNCNGVWQGANTTSCQNCSPAGACCVNGNTCNTGVTQANCGGVWQGAGSTTCQNCSLTGACCVNGNTCNTGVTQAACNGQSGVWQANSTTCQNCTLPPATVPIRLRVPWDKESDPDSQNGDEYCRASTYDGHLHFGGSPGKMVSVDFFYSPTSNECARYADADAKSRNIRAAHEGTVKMHSRTANCDIGCTLNPPQYQVLEIEGDDLSSPPVSVRTRYIHLQPTVTSGEVDPGKVIGKNDRRGCACNHHLHFEVDRKVGNTWVAARFDNGEVVFDGEVAFDNQFLCRGSLPSGCTLLNGKEWCGYGAMPRSGDPGGIDPDNDGDGIDNEFDACPDTSLGASVDDDGCADFELDDDADGVSNDGDDCPETAADVLVNSSGCPRGECSHDSDCDDDELCESGECKPDSDRDGIPNERDLCPNTGPGSSVRDDGCVRYTVTVSFAGVIREPQVTAPEEGPYSYCAPSNIDGSEFLRWDGPDAPSGPKSEDRCIELLVDSDKALDAVYQQDICSRASPCGACGNGACVGMIMALFGWLGLRFVGPRGVLRGEKPSAA